MATVVCACASAPTVRAPLKAAPVSGPAWERPTPTAGQEIHRKPLVLQGGDLLYITVV